MLLQQSQVHFTHLPALRGTTLLKRLPVGSLANLEPSYHLAANLHHRINLDPR